MNAIEIRNLSRPVWLRNRKPGRKKPGLQPKKRAADQQAGINASLGR